MEHKVTITITTTGETTEDAIIDIVFTPPIKKEGMFSTVEIAAAVMLQALSGSSKTPMQGQSQKRGEA